MGDEVTTEEASDLDLLVHKVVWEARQHEKSRLSSAIERDLTVLNRLKERAATELRRGGKHLGTIASTLLSSEYADPFTVLEIGSELAQAAPELLDAALAELGNEPQAALALCLGADENLSWASSSRLQSLISRAPESIPQSLARYFFSRRREKSFQLDFGSSHSDESPPETVRPASRCHLRDERASPEALCSDMRGKRTKLMEPYTNLSRVLVLAVLLAYEALDPLGLERICEENNLYKSSIVSEQFSSLTLAEAARFRLLHAGIASGHLPRTLVRPLSRKFDPVSQRKRESSRAIRSYLNLCSESGTVPDLKMLVEVVEAAIVDRPEVESFFEEYEAYFGLPDEPLTVGERWDNLIDAHRRKRHRRIKL
ncbi:hypothetical protein NDN08_002528 [Rhodosorus marinus]|uniref:Uncharacterized protein n=1 Tax=Rhodosorus marinus TaxID=101924 RepID=A0AAV8UWP7_9RHOD|nr:hypothetical protein NDN08_002528 [Rhodosorus marinus]